MSIVALEISQASGPRDILQIRPGRGSLPCCRAQREQPGYGRLQPLTSRAPEHINIKEGIIKLSLPLGIMSCVSSLVT